MKNILKWAILIAWMIIWLPFVISMIVLHLITIGFAAVDTFLTNLFIAIEEKVSDWLGKLSDDEVRT